MNKRRQEDIDLSVVIPAYNAAKSIERAVNNIQNVKTKYRIQVIIVDDGSTDNTLVKCHALIELYPNITVLSQDNKGPAAARALGLSLALGKFITFLDADDYWDSSAYSLLMDHVMNNDTDITEFGYREVYDDGQIISENKLKYVVRYGEEIAAHNAMHNDKETASVVWNKIYHRFLFDNIIFPDLFCGEDSCILVQVMSNAQTYECIYGSYYNYVTNALSLTRRKAINKKLDGIQAGKFMLSHYRKYQMSLVPYALRYLVRTTLSLNIEITRNKIKGENVFIPYINSEFYKYLWQLICINKGMRCLCLKDYILIIIYIFFGANGCVFISKLKRAIKR